jgi:hypothetical protein
LHRLAGIRTRLVELGNQRAYDQDAMAWQLLSPVSEEFLARDSWLGEGNGRPPGPIRGGLLAPEVALLSRARHPSEWTLCSCCEGAGRSGADEGVCAPCRGRGYQIVE